MVSTERNLKSIVDQRVFARSQRDDQENELNYHGESLMFVGTCETAEDILNRGIDYSLLRNKQV